MHVCVCVCVDLNYKCCRICLLGVVSAQRPSRRAFWATLHVMRVKKDASFSRCSWLPSLLLLLLGHLVVLF